MEKHPNSRMCFVCGIGNPIGLKLKFYTEDEGRCVARFRPGSEHQATPAICTGASSPPYRTSLPEFLYTLTFSLYDSV